MIHENRRLDKKIPRNWVIPGKILLLCASIPQLINTSIYCWAEYKMPASCTKWHTSTNLEVRSRLRSGNGSIFTRLRLYHSIADEHIISQHETSYARPNKWSQKMDSYDRRSKLLRSMYLYLKCWEVVRLSSHHRVDVTKFTRTVCTLSIETLLSERQSSKVAKYYKYIFIYFKYSFKGEWSYN